MSKLLAIIFAGLFASVITCSDKYREIGVPKLQQLCKKVVEKDFYTKADQLFALVQKQEINEVDDQKLQKLLEYNTRLQHPFAQVYIQLPSLVNLAEDKNGLAPLHYSALNDAERTTAQLLAASANVHAKDNKDRTPLHYSLFHNAYKPTLQLLAVGADVYAKDNDGWTPLDCTTSTEIKELLLKAYKKNHPVKVQRNSAKKSSHFQIS